MSFFNFFLRPTKTPAVAVAPEPKSQATEPAEPVVAETLPKFITVKTRSPVKAKSK